MAALTTQTPGQTYGDLLQVSNLNDGIDATLREISDGKGTAGPFLVSETGVRFKATATIDALSGASAVGTNFDWTGTYTYNAAAVIDMSAMTASNLTLPLTIETDIINEQTADTGVTVDGCLIKDGIATLAQTLQENVTVVTAAGPYTVLAADDIVVINQTVAAAITVNLPAIGTTGRRITIKDGKGDASANNITIDASGAETIDGATTFLMNGDGWSLTIIDNGTEWNVT